MSMALMRILLDPPGAKRPTMHWMSALSGTGLPAKGLREVGWHCRELLPVQCWMLCCGPSARIVATPLSGVGAATPAMCRAVRCSASGCGPVWRLAPEPGLRVVRRGRR